MPTLAQRWVEKGVEKGMEAGMKEGKKVERLEIARRLIKKGIDLNIISDSTGISREEIEELAVKG